MTGQRIGLLGGTFDPPHRGHLALARAALATGTVDVVYLVVAGDPYEKRGTVVASALDRLAMVRALAGDEPHLVVSTVEIDRAGPSYTVDTVAELLASGAASVTLVVGADVAASIDRWRDAERLATTCDVLVATRPGTRLTLNPRWRATVLADLEDPCASRDLRADLLAGRSTGECLPDDVVRELTDRGLYDGRRGHP